MARERWITVETARKVLTNTCDFLEKDEVADFRIVNGKEAVLLSIYSLAFFLLNEEYKFKFRPVLDGDYTREPLNMIPLKSEVMSINEVPIFGSPLSWYFSFFPNLNEPKYLFLIDKRNYAKRKSRELYIVRNLLEKTKASSINSTDCLVWISNEDGTFGEGFWEYVSGIVLRNKGYFVTRYASAPHGHGRSLIYGFGDLSAYYIPEYLERLMKRGFLNGGAFIEELEMLRKCFNQNVKQTKSNYEAIIIEAESSDVRVRSHSKDGVGQLINKYLSFESGYSSGIVTGPFCTNYENIHCQDEKCSCKAVGLISCDENGNLVYLPPKRRYLQPREEKIEGIKNLIKCVLLRNLTLEERCKLIKIHSTNIKDYFERILSLDIDTILEKIEEKSRFPAKARLA